MNWGELNKIVIISKSDESIYSVFILNKKKHKKYTNLLKAFQ